MGYRNNPELVTERWDLLSPLEAGQEYRWAVKGDWDATHRVAFKIREGLHIARRHPARFPKLASAAARMSIHIVEVGVIEARLRAVDSVESAPDYQRVPQQGGDIPVDKTVPSIALPSADDIISAWNAHLPSNNPLTFKQTVLPLPELLRLHAWATTQHPKLMFLVGEHNQTIMLSLHDMSASEYSWSPPKARAPEEKFNL
jgi:hypothetical protein